MVKHDESNRCTMATQWSPCNTNKTQLASVETIEAKNAWIPAPKEQIKNINNSDPWYRPTQL